jgi:hypothetical protein
MCSRFEAAAHFSIYAGARGVRTIKSADLFDMRVPIYMKHQCQAHLDVRIRGCRDKIIRTRYPVQNSAAPDLYEMQPKY